LATSRNGLAAGRTNPLPHLHLVSVATIVGLLVLLIVGSLTLGTPLAIPAPVAATIASALGALVQITLVTTIAPILVTLILVTPITLTPRVIIEDLHTTLTSVPSTTPVANFASRFLIIGEALIRRMIFLVAEPAM
jgi:hypothetical protein